MPAALRMTGSQHEELRRHLFPGDGKEAVALAICGRGADGDRRVFAVRELAAVPHEDCDERTETRVTWPTRYADDLLRKALRRGFAVAKFHSHPGGLGEFSETDDESDRRFFGAVHTLLEVDRAHVSAVMLPDGRVFARSIDPTLAFRDVDLVTSVGDDLRMWPAGGGGGAPAFAERHALAFGPGTAGLLRRLSVAVVGCSGTGSPLIEQLTRLGVGRLVLVDPDRVEERNLNRIVHSTRADAALRKMKVEVLAKAVCRIGLGTEVVPIADYLDRPAAVRAVSTCDVVFGCVDSAHGRDMLNRLATFYSLPYFDLGVLIRVNASGEIEQVSGVVHYLQPGLSSLRSRNLYDGEDVRAELLRRDNPAEYERLRRERYVRGVAVDRPAVVSLNTQVAAMGVNEFLARIRPYRNEPNRSFAVNRVALHEGFLQPEGEDRHPVCPILERRVGRGDATPLLDRPELTE